MKRTVTFLLVCFFISGLSVAILQAVAMKKDKYGKGFRRVFPPHFLLSARNLELDEEDYYIAGIVDNKIYLGSYKNPLKMMITDIALKDTQYLILEYELPGKRKLIKPGTQFYIDSSNVFLIEGTTSTVLRNSLHQIKNVKFLYNPYITSLNAVPISSSTIILRTYEKSTKEGRLTKVMLDSNKVKHVNNVLKKQLDGFFCTSGILHYDSKTKKVIYVYFYRNEFLILDTNLNLLSARNTIDTNTRVKIKVAEIKSDNSKTLSSPPVMVNRNSCIDGNYLYNNSALASDNERKEAFQNNSVVDLYNLNKGTYLYSFYIPDINYKKLGSFKVAHNQLVAIHGKRISVYDLNTDYLSKNKN
jgi:hypothetical protein